MKHAQHAFIQGEDQQLQHARRLRYHHIVEQERNARRQQQTVGRTSPLPPAFQIQQPTSQGNLIDMGSSLGEVHNPNDDDEQELLAQSRICT